jgi:hypothetical protein
VLGNLLNVLQLLDCSLDVSMYLKGPATGVTDADFLGFSVFEQMLRCFPSSVSKGKIVYVHNPVPRRYDIKECDDTVPNAFVTSTL